MNNYTKKRGNSKASKSSKRPNSKKKFDKKDITDSAQDINGDDARRSLNDVDWYARSPRLLMDAASFPFATAVGSRVKFNNSMVNDYHVPGIMRINIIPSIGCSQSRTGSATDAVNLAAQNVYSYVRHMNSGHANYDAPDLMLYLLAYDQISMYHAWMKRIYGVARYYSMYNWYLGKALLYTMRVDPDDITRNLADLRQAINMLAAQMEMFFVPDSFPIFKRHAYMFENVYMDDMSVKSQFFYFSPAGFGKYVAMEGDQTYGIIEAVTPFTGSNRLTVDDMVSFGQSLINAFVTQEDCGIISGDIKKAYNDAGLIKLEMINDDYIVTPVFTMELLEQIHNGKILGVPDYSVLNSHSVLFGQDPSTNLIYEGFKFPYGYSELLAPGEVLFNLHTDNVTPAVTMVASRLTAIVEDNTGSLGAHGTEIITAIHIFTLRSDGTLEPTSINLGTYLNVASSITFAQASALVKQLTTMSNFNFAPLITVDIADNASQTSFSRQFIGNLNNVTVMTTDDLEDMNDVAVMSEFGVPIVGTFSK